MSFVRSIIWPVVLLIVLGSYFYFFEMKRPEKARERRRNIEMEALSMLPPEDIRDKIRREKAERLLTKKVFVFCTNTPELTAGFKSFA